MAKIVKDGTPMVVVEQVHRNKGAIPGMGGVYVITNPLCGGAIEYIGQSACLRQRLFAHQHPWVRIPALLSGWDAIFYLIDDEQERKATEVRLIQSCCPRMNVAHNRRRL